MIDAPPRAASARFVIGGGLLAPSRPPWSALRGMDVTVVHVMPWLMERQLDAAAGAILQQSMESRGHRLCA